MCRPTTVDYTADTTDITQLRNQAASGRAGCCTCSFVKSGRFGSFNKLTQYMYDGVTPNGQGDIPWTAEVFVASDGTAGQVTVFQKHKVVNKTADTASYPDTRPVSDEDLKAMVAKIPEAIARAWNGRAYKLKITDRRCGERLFDVRFVVSMVETEGHYTLHFVNVPGMGTAPDVRGVLSGRSYIISPNQGKFNLGDYRTATNNDHDESLEVHEFGHMIGLIDEYPDQGFNRGGVRYLFPDGTTEMAGVTSELMGTMSNKVPIPTRYCVTVACAAISVLEANGFAVTDCEIL